MNKYIYEATVEGPEEAVESFYSDAYAEVEVAKANIPLMGFVDGFLFDNEPVEKVSVDRLESISNAYPELLITVIEYPNFFDPYGAVKTWLRNGKYIDTECDLVFPTPDLDRDIPAPAAEQIIEKHRQAKREALRAEIARLTEELEELR